MELQQIKRIIEAALLAAPQPLTLPQLAGLFDALDLPAQDEIARAVTELKADCAGRGIELVEVASGWRYQVCTDVHTHVARLWAERPSRYSRALLETLALIAYRQPITRGEIEQVRGVAVSTNIVRTLEEREWIRVVGHRDLPGKPALLGTTRQFLDYFNLKALDELPALSEIHDLEDFEPQLDLDGGTPNLDAPALAGVTASEDAANDAEAASDMGDFPAASPLDMPAGELDSPPSEPSRALSSDGATPRDTPESNA
ncbi:SMC-Scp complex subunit ScpB [Dokdonella sp.]|uniref:SMC-Scp complex subunit ScpB n=1 Tax=Dokdonella sp. TaxID=2291710 RepID=UPI0031BE0883|nr:SMC-Scp complex subunit ScpB [Dokdonella sp.]